MHTRPALVVIGFTTITAQVVLMREYVAAFYGNELLFGIVLAVWMAWTAIGAWGLSRWAPRRIIKFKYLAVGLILAGILFPTQLASVRAIRSILGVTSGASVEFGPMVLAIAITLAPLCLLGGFLFTLGARLTIERNGTAGQAYVWESAGAITGGILFSFILIRWCNPFQTALLVVLVNLIVVSNILLDGFLSLLNRIMASLFLLALLGTFAFILGNTLNLATLRWQWANMIYTSDSPYGRLTIQARDGQFIFYQDSLLAFETQSTFPEEVVHFPMLAHPAPRTVLLIGGGISGDLRELAKHPIEHIAYVELDPQVIKAARNYLPSELVSVLDDPHVTLIFDDGRHYVKQAATNVSLEPEGIQTYKYFQGKEHAQEFDVIILDLPEPSTGSLNRFYTREFFTEVRTILKPGGIFSLDLPSAENYWSPELARRNASIYQTLRSVFAQVLVLPGEHNFFLSSDTTIQDDPGVLATRFTERKIQTQWVTPEYIKFLLTSDRFAETRQQLEAQTGVRINQDMAPICYYYDLAFWLSRFYPELGVFFEKTSQLANPTSSAWILGGEVLLLFLMLIVLHFFSNWKVPVIVAAVGSTQMILEVIILLAFQVLHGYVYAQISLLVASFMGGLALGGGLSNHIIRGQTRNPSKTKRWLIFVLGNIAIYCIVFPRLLTWNLPAPQITFSLLALVAGSLTGMVYPLSVILLGGDPGATAGNLYGADLVGGCLGSFLGSIFLVPLLGVAQTCTVIALIALAGLVSITF